MQLLMGTSIRRYAPPMGTAGLARCLVRGYRRVPAPPPRMMAASTNRQTTPCHTTSGDTFGCTQCKAIRRLQDSCACDCITTWHIPSERKLNCSAGKTDVFTDNTVLQRNCSITAGSGPAREAEAAGANSDAAKCADEMLGGDPSSKQHPTHCWSIRTPNELLSTAAADAMRLIWLELITL